MKNFEPSATTKWQEVMLLFLSTLTYSLEFQHYGGNDVEYNPVAIAHAIIDKSCTPFQER